MRNNSTTEMNFRCVEVRVCKQEDFLAKPEQEEGVGGWGGGGGPPPPPSKIDSPHQIVCFLLPKVHPPLSPPPLPPLNKNFHVITQ